MSSRRFHCVGVGEVLWDLLPSGKQLGGAPANFAYHAHSLGMEADLVTRIGGDDLGRGLLEQLERLQLGLAHVQVDEEAATGTVSVTLNGDGVPNFTILEGAAWDGIKMLVRTEKRCREADAICFGSLAQRCGESRKTIRRLLAVARKEALRVFDINLRQSYYTQEIVEQSLKLANVLKLNDAELPVLAQMFGLNHSVESQIETLADKFELQLVAYTRGPRGSLLYSGGRWSDHAGLPTSISDTVGAGDSFTAAMTVGWLRGLGLEEVNTLANEVASYVCSCAGATPRLPEELCVKFTGQKKAIAPTNLTSIGAPIGIQQAR